MRLLRAGGLPSGLRGLGSAPRRIGSGGEGGKRAESGVDALRGPFGGVGWGRWCPLLRPGQLFGPTSDLRPLVPRPAKTEMFF